MQNQSNNISSGIVQSTISPSEALFLLNRDVAANQLQTYRSNNEPILMTSLSGMPIGDKVYSLTAGSRGPILLQDTYLLDELGQFNEEKIPERCSYGKGSGAFGFFQCTTDIGSTLTRAHFLDTRNKQTPIAIRFSRFRSELGSSDTIRDIRGMAIKFYTDCGNFDLICNHLPIFFIRDPILYPSLVHSQKRNPVTNLFDYDAYWDFLTLRPETTHCLVLLYSHRGIPNGYRYMNSYSVNTYKFLSRDDDISYVRFHIKSNQGISSIDSTKALVLAGLDSDYATRDLYNTICIKKELPSWTVCIQQMNEQEMKNSSFDPFDTTKIWPKTYYPLIALGTITLNRLPSNHFSEIEQLAFSPANLVPGIELSQDKMLQARVFAYSDAQRYRLGKNYGQLPVNRPLNPIANNYRDGYMCLNNQNGSPNYFPNSFHGATTSYRFKETIYSVEGNVARYECSNDNDDFNQVKTFYRQILSPDERINLARNLAKSLALTQQFICKRALENFSNVDQDLVNDIQHFLNLQRPTKMEDSGIQTDLERKI
ncbi:unnamed protein product [Rotaria sordida]|uniref:Catalase core domain-containing protein n=1 Tax=Rotaria sordida TaxID=392033 RepID=A0A814PCZ7_9BILA|nr:unnamed protein product [Rotaria sordida]CAF3678710.1 unnamed protein product [Rotaria sordida]